MKGLKLSCFDRLSLEEAKKRWGTPEGMTPEQIVQAIQDNGLEARTQLTERGPVVQVRIPGTNDGVVSFIPSDPKLAWTLVFRLVNDARQCAAHPDYYEEVKARPRPVELTK